MSSNMYHVVPFVSLTISKASNMFGEKEFLNILRLILFMFSSLLFYSVWKYLDQKPLGYQTVFDSMIKDLIIATNALFLKREHHSQLPSNPSFKSFRRFHFSENYAWFHNIDELFHHAIYVIKITQPICSFSIHWISNAENDIKWYKWTIEACINLHQIATHVNYVISCSFIWFHARASNVWKSFQSCL